MCGDQDFNLRHNIDGMNECGAPRCLHHVPSSPNSLKPFDQKLYVWVAVPNNAKIDYYCYGTRITSDSQETFYSGCALGTPGFPYLIFLHLCLAYLIFMIIITHFCYNTNSIMDSKTGFGVMGN